MEFHAFGLQSPLGVSAPPLGALWEPLGPPSAHLHVLGMYPIGIPQPFLSLAERTISSKVSVLRFSGSESPTDAAHELWDSPAYNKWLI